MRYLSLATLLLVTGCMSAPPINVARSSCSNLLPDSWLVPVPGAELPLNAVMGDWIVFGSAQTGQLAKESEQKVAGFGIIKRCEERDREAVAKARKRFLGILR